MPIPFPTFEICLERILETVDLLDDGDYPQAERSLKAVHTKLTLVRSSSRHQELAEFAGHALTTCRRGGYEGARSVLLTAAELFSGDVTNTPDLPKLAGFLRARN